MKIDYNKIYAADCASLLKDPKVFPSNSIDLILTSPPYADKRGKNYNTITEKDYVEWFLTISKELLRVLKKDGVAIININSKSFKKNLVLIPYDFIKQMEQIGFIFKDVHYWHKSSGIPRRDNLGDHFEYFLIFFEN